MPSKVPPTGGSPSQPELPSDKPKPPPHAGGGGQSFDEFLATFTPEEHRKFMNILGQNLAKQIEKASKKYIEELRKERENIEKGE